MRMIVVFAGTRPEIIKMAPIVRELRARQRTLPRTGNEWCTHFCFSGQHDELAVPLLKYFDIQPDSQLNLMDSGQSLGQLASRAAAQLDAFFEKQTDACAALVQGDTTTAVMAALAAFYHRIPVGHVEAGLRTSQIAEPFPEELNRRLIARIAKWHYAPTEKARLALLGENVAPESILVTKNTGIDSFLWASSRPHKPILRGLVTLEEKRTVFITVHRRENIGARLDSITAAIVELAHEFGGVVFILPVHRNPDVEKTIRMRLADVSNILLTEPLDYADAVWAMKHAELVMTDSGGIQEEMPSLNKATLVLRDETERTEAVEYGTSFLVGSDQKRIVTVAREFLTGKRKLFLKGSCNPYGDGDAAKRIVDHVLSQMPT